MTLGTEAGPWKMLSVTDRETTPANRADAGLI